ncbi:MAG: FAD-dependent oxidoreductase, partial [Archaeoglobaceae archaeon]|nr:FAD-dependent oxidoreductase [Archaeoglobaceae archaeon]
MSAASRIKALRPEWSVTVFESSNFVSHAPCGIPYVVEGITKASELMYYPPEYFIRERGIDLHINSKVLEARKGYVKVLENGVEKVYEWDKLLIATGALPKVPQIKGLELENVFTIRHPSQADLLKKSVEMAEKIVIVGAGYLGIEMAEASVMRGKKVTIIEFLDQPLPNLDKDMAEFVKKRMERVVNLRLGEKVEEFEGKDSVKRVVTNKGEYEADVVIVATGIKANTKIAEDLKCDIGKTGAIYTDSKMRTSVENVYAAGDCAETIHLVTKKRVWVPLAPTANKMGYVAGVNIAGGDLDFPGVLGTQFTKFFEMEIGSTGLNEKTAKLEGFDVKTAFITAKTKVDYYPGASEIVLKVVADKNSNRILGAQAVGSEVAMRINTISCMIQANFTVKDVFFADLGYAPPLTPIWEPIIVSARVLKF